MPSWAQHDPGLGSFIHSITHSITSYLLGNSNVQASSQGLVAAVKETQSLFSHKEHMGYPVPERQWLFPISVLSFCQVSRLLTYLCIAAGGPLSCETLGGMKCYKNTSVNPLPEIKSGQGEGTAQVVERMLSMHDVLGSILSTTT